MIDTVGGETAQRALQKIRPGGAFVTAVTVEGPPQRPGVRSLFFYAEVTTQRLENLTELLDEGKLRVRVGSVLPLMEVRAAHHMLAGAPHKPGKIVLDIGTPRLQDGSTQFVS